MSEAVAGRPESVAVLPARLNLGLLVVAASASAGLLWGASHAPSLLAVAACALLFSFTANTLFSLLHESVHGLFDPRLRRNEWAGRFAAAWFPTGLTLQRAFHLTHHRNNRSPLEQFDVLHEGDVKWLKRAQWYAILTGVYWAIAVAGALVFLLIPRSLLARFSRRVDPKVAEQTSSGAYLAALDGIDPVKARLEIFFSFAFQIALVAALGLSVRGWLACYAAFALSWSSLQYADHAFSPLDAHEGAWNLRVNPVSRAFFLNYHYHLAHHQNPRVPWNRLPELVDRKAPQPSFLRIWLAMWRGPRRAPALAAAEILGRSTQRDAARDSSWRQALDVEILCLRDYLLFARRHPRYLLIACAIYGASLPRWRSRRVLRTGFCLLQHVDDLLDGDRPSDREPLEVVDGVIEAIESGRFGKDPLQRLARAFAGDLSRAGGEPAVAEALELIREMQKDRRRVLDRARWNREEIRDHLRQTFRLSVDLMLIAAGAELRAEDVPELIDAFGWCSTMRDLREDLAAGLVNIPREVLEAARAEGIDSLDVDRLLTTDSIRRWLRDEHERAGLLLDATDRRLDLLAGRKGVSVLRLFARSIRSFARKRFPRRFSGLVEAG